MSTGSSRNSSCSVLEPSVDTDRIASSPLPMPGFGLATCSHLLRQLKIGRCSCAVRVVVGHRQAIAGRLTHPHVAWDHGIEHEVGEMLPDLPLDVAAQPRAAVV